MGLSAYAAIASGLFIALWKHPAVALAGVLCMFGLEQWGQATTIFFIQHQTATNLLIGGILLLALMVQGAKKGVSIFAGYPAVGWVILMLFLYAFASAQWAPRPDISLKLWASRWPYIVTIVLLSPLLITDARDIRSAYKATILVGGFLTILLLFFVKWETRHIVLDHDMGNPLAISAMAGMVALIVILADSWQESKPWFALKWGLVALCLALIVRSGSRGQLLGVLLVSVTCWPISRGLKNVKQFAVLSLLILFLGAATSWTIHEFWSSEFPRERNRWSEQSAEQDVSGRLTNALLLVHLAADSPETLLFGLGNSASYDPRILGIYPHFVPLEILAEEGIIGAILFSLIIFLTAKVAIRSYAAVRLLPSERATLSALLGMFGFTLLLALKQGSMLGNLEPFMFAIIIARFERFHMPAASPTQISTVGFAHSLKLEGLASSSGIDADGLSDSIPLHSRSRAKQWI